MRVFLMWSGAASQTVATELHGLLKTVLQGVDYFISVSDIENGALWQSTLSAELGVANAGIACLTPENLDSSWIHFECGAISRLSNETRVIPYLFSIDQSQVRGPLTLFQSVPADEIGTLGLVKSLNSMRPQPERLEPEFLEQAFHLYWPKFLKATSQIHQGETTLPSRTPADLLSEVLGYVRELERNLRSQLQISNKDILDALNDRMHRIDRGITYHRLAEDLAARGRFDEAQVASQQALEVNPSSQTARIGIAKILRRKAFSENGDKETLLNKAIETLNDVIRLDAKCERAFYNRCCYKILIGTYEIDDALDDLESAVSLSPHYREFVEGDPDLASLLNNTRFQSIISSPSS